MATTYQIFFNNQRKQAGNYAVFTQPPKLNSSSKSVYTNTWMTFPVPIGGTFQVDSTTQYYAWCGTVPTSPAPGVIVQTGQAIPVVLGTADPHVPGSTLPMVVSGGYPTFNLKTESATAKPGAFAIQTGDDFDVPNTRYMIGLAQTNSDGINAPTATILADNNKFTQITPVVEFYIGEFDSETGTIIDFAESSANAAKINFSTGSGSGFTSAVVNHEPNGDFIVKYVPNED